MKFSFRGRLRNLLGDERGGRRVQALIRSMSRRGRWGVAVCYEEENDNFKNFYDDAHLGAFWYGKRKRIQ